MQAAEKPDTGSSKGRRSCLHFSTQLPASKNALSGDVWHSLFQNSTLQHAKTPSKHLFLSQNQKNLSFFNKIFAFFLASN